ncbi:MAG TPA: hypothetical protein VFB63_06580 [Bryobacteraceae bacterium]|jgi:hypothetical protein|nr:hypothetical protein [Bryobacteraceae bacterium]
MKYVLRIAAVVLPLACSATFAMAQSNPDGGVVTGSENSIREVIGEPQLKDDGGSFSDEAKAAEREFQRRLQEER